MKTSSLLWEIIEDKSALKPYTGASSSYIKNAILFEVSDDCEDGTYPRPSDYVRLANRLDTHGSAAWINRLTRKKNKLKIDYMGCIIIRDNDWQDAAILEFETPIEVVFGYIGEEPIIKTVKKIKGEFVHDWFWLSKGRQDKIANGFEIYFNIEEYLE
jgi:hypothetical protein